MSQTELRPSESNKDNVKLTQFGRKGSWTNAETETAIPAPSQFRRPKPTLFDKKDPDLDFPLSGQKQHESPRASLRRQVSDTGSEKTFTSIVDETDLDRLSQYSLYMVKDFRYYFQHPYLRLFIAYFVCFCNFLIYAEDPVAHSVKECSIPLIGNVFAFVCTRYPPKAWSLFKVFMWSISIVMGMVFGKLVFHQLLLGRALRLKAFGKDRGSWMIMFFTVLISCFVGSWVYNAFLLIDPDVAEKYWISSLMGVTFSWFMKAAACGTWMGDVITAWMVTDMMLQEKLYPLWATPLREWWGRGWHRIILFWTVNLSLTIVVVTVITTDWISWDSLNHGFLSTNELSRSFLASFILVMDLLIIMQDWDFPHFTNSLDIKLPGLNVAHIDFEITRFLSKDQRQVHISGKWFNYGIIFFVMLLDLNMWKNQIFYDPIDYGQYVNADRRIITVRNETQLEFYNLTEISFLFRSSTIDVSTGLPYIEEDVRMNSRYDNVDMTVKSIAFIPSLIAFVVFGALVYVFGRFKASKKDVFAGRLKKRKRKRKNGDVVDSYILSGKEGFVVTSLPELKIASTLQRLDDPVVVDNSGKHVQQTGEAIT